MTRFGLHVRVTSRHVGHEKGLTSIELNVFPLYTSANSEAREGVLNLSKTRDRFGAESLTIVAMR